MKKKKTHTRVPRKPPESTVELRFYTELQAKYNEATELIKDYRARELTRQQQFRALRAAAAETLQDLIARTVSLENALKALPASLE